MMRGMSESTFPDDLAAIDTMMGTRAGPNAKFNYENLTGIKDADSRSLHFPAQYMFKDVPTFSALGDRIKYTLAQMDTFNIERALIGVSLQDEVSKTALRQHPDRFIACVAPNPMMEWKTSATS